MNATETPDERELVLFRYVVKKLGRSLARKLRDAAVLKTWQPATRSRVRPACRPRYFKSEIDAIAKGDELTVADVVTAAKP